MALISIKMQLIKTSESDNNCTWGLAQAVKGWEGFVGGSKFKYLKKQKKTKKRKANKKGKPKQN